MSCIKMYIVSNSQVYRTIQFSLIFHVSISQHLPTSSVLEHTIRPTSTRKQDILRELRSQLPKPTFRCGLFFRRLSSCNLCFTLCFCSSEGHGFSLLKSKSFESFLLSCLFCCFFRCCDTAYQLFGIGRRDGALTLSSHPSFVVYYLFP